MTVIQSNLKIAIVDDEAELAEATGWEVEDAGYEPFLVVKGHFKNVNDLASVILEKTQGAICDNRLTNSGLANFSGAELVATLYDWKFPSLLISQFVEIDTSSSIRKWRRKIPVLLSRDKANASSITKGIEACQQELSGYLPITRKPSRTLVRIVDLDQASHEPVVDAIVPGWNPHKAIRFPASLIPETIRSDALKTIRSDALKKGVRLFAHVNIGADNADDLYFDKFELAPEPDDDDGLA